MDLDAEARHLHFSTLSRVARLVRLDLDGGVGLERQKNVPQHAAEGVDDRPPLHRAVHEDDAVGRGPVQSSGREGGHEVRLDLLPRILQRLPRRRHRPPLLSPLHHSPLPLVRLLLGGRRGSRGEQCHRCEHQGNGEDEGQGGVSADLQQQHAGAAVAWDERLQHQLPAVREGSRDECADHRHPRAAVRVPAVGTTWTAAGAGARALLEVLADRVARAHRDADEHHRLRQRLCERPGLPPRRGQLARAAAAAAAAAASADEPPPPAAAAMPER
mmetsp:Transcript_75361/g.194280  ORF Transcript_75361/g.194280 Transcript_75361/m.194280 type:complete len:273 (+) Transcript_75361:198-1016(+)